MPITFVAWDPVANRPDSIPSNAWFCWDHNQYHTDYDNFDREGRLLDGYGNPVGEYNYEDDEDDDDDDFDEDEDRDDDNVRGLLHGYSYKPDPRFHGTGPLFLGAEIELECGSRRGNAARAALSHLGRNEDIGYLKSDGSLDCGIEIVTHPMSYDWALEHFPWGMFDELDRIGARAEPDSCGLHVHVSRDGFRTKSHALQWFRFIYQHEDQVCKLARRRSNQWASFHRRPGELAKAAKNELYDVERYRAINVQNYHTFEVRVFGSSLEADMVKATLGFVDASVRYAGILQSHDVVTGRRGTWADFTDFVSSHDKYDPLSKQLDKLGLTNRDLVAA